MSTLACLISLTKMDKGVLKDYYHMATMGENVN